MARDSREALEERHEELVRKLWETRQELEALRSKSEAPIAPLLRDESPSSALDVASFSFRALVEAISEGAATFSEQGTVLYCNPRFARMLGVAVDRIVGSALEQWVPEGRRPRLAALLAQARGGEARSQMRLRAISGEELPVHLSISSLFGSGERLHCLLAVDLRDQKRSEQIVAEGRLASSVLDQAADAVIVCDDRGRVIRASLIAEKLYGCCPPRASFDAAFPLRLTSATPDEGLARAALRGRVIRGAPATLQRVDGTLAELLASATPLTGNDGRILGCVVTLVDVTDVRRAEAALRASEERVRTLGDNLPDGVVYRYRQDPQGATHFDYISAGIEQLTGVSPAEILRDPAALIGMVEPEDRGRRDEAEHLSREELRRFEVELRLRHRRTGEVRWVLLRSVPRRLADGTTVWDGLQFDITERRRAEEALRQADEAKNQFLAMLSHELRNPLMPIRNGLYVLERAEPGSEQARRARSVISRQVDHVARLVDDLLDVTRIIRGKVNLQREACDLREVVGRTVEDMRAVFESAGVSFDVRLEDCAFPALADRTRLSQAVGNLLQNAAKFTPRGGNTWVELRRTIGGAEAMLRIRDNGSGIQPEMLSRLFQPFAQADTTLDRSRGGLGLGLSLVKGMVELHGGSVTARSAGVGSGAEFVLRLPLLRVEAQVDEDGGAAELQSNRRARHDEVGEQGLSAAAEDRGSGE